MPTLKNYFLFYDFKSSSSLCWKSYFRTYSTRLVSKFFVQNNDREWNAKDFVSVVHLSIISLHNEYWCPFEVSKWILIKPNARYSQKIITSINLARFISCYFNSELTEQKWGIAKGFVPWEFLFLWEDWGLIIFDAKEEEGRRNMYSHQIYFIFFSFWAFSLLQHSTIAEPRNEIVWKGMWYIWTSMVGFTSDTMSATSVFFLSDWLRSLANKNISIASLFSLRKL